MTASTPAPAPAVPATVESGRACALSLATLFVSIRTLRGLKFGPSKHDADVGPTDDYDLPPLDEAGSAVDEASGRLHGVAPLPLGPKAQWPTEAPRPAAGCLHHQNHPLQHAGAQGLGT